jgi:hypothetical protein
MVLAGELASVLACGGSEPDLDRGGEPGKADDVGAGGVLVVDRDGGRHIYERGEAIVAGGQPRRLIDAGGRVHRFELDARADVVISVGGSEAAGVAGVARPAGEELLSGAAVERVELLPDPEPLAADEVRSWQHAVARGLPAGSYDLVLRPDPPASADLTVVVDARPPAPATAAIEPIPIVGAHRVTGYGAAGRGELEVPTSPLAFELHHSADCVAAPAVPGRVPLDCYRLDVRMPGELADAVTLPAGAVSAEVHAWGAQLETIATDGAGADVPVKLMFEPSRTTLRRLYLHVLDPDRADRLYELTVEPIDR